MTLLSALPLLWWGFSLRLRLAQGWQHDAPRRGGSPCRHTEPATGEPEGLQGAAGGGTREIEGRWLWVRLASQPVVRLLRETLPQPWPCAGAFLLCIGQVGL